MPTVVTTISSTAVSASTKKPTSTIGTFAAPGSTSQIVKPKPCSPNGAHVRTAPATTTIATSQHDDHAQDRDDARRPRARSRLEPAADERA